MEYMLQGNIKAANEHFQRSVDITPKMALNLIDILRRESIEYIVAPYEADAQLTYLSMNNLVDAVITEDSDLIPYGCPRIIYKLDKTGNAREIDLSNISSSKEMDFSSFTLEMFRHMCILSGCDYLPSIPSLGIKTAYNLVKEYKDIDKILEVINNNKKYKVPDNYTINFKKADITFLHQVVYDPVTQSSVPLRPLPNNVSVKDIPFVGNNLAKDIAIGIATGILDPHTHQPFLLSEKEMENLSKPLHSNISSDKMKSIKVDIPTIQTEVVKECLKDSIRFSIKKAKIHPNHTPPNSKNQILHYFQYKKKRDPPQVITDRDLNPPFMTKKQKVIELSETYRTAPQPHVVIKSKYFEEKTGSNESSSTCTTATYSQEDFIDLDFDEPFVFTSSSTEENSKDNISLNSRSDSVQEIATLSQSTHDSSLTQSSDNQVIEIDTGTPNDFLKEETTPKKTMTFLEFMRS